MKLGGPGPARIVGLSDNLTCSRNSRAFPWRTALQALALMSISFVAGCVFHYVAFRFAP